MAGLAVLMSWNGPQYPHAWELCACSHPCVVTGFGRCGHTENPRQGHKPGLSTWAQLELRVTLRRERSIRARNKEAKYRLMLLGAKVHGHLQDLQQAWSGFCIVLKVAQWDLGTRFQRLVVSERKAQSREWCPQLLSPVLFWGQEGGTKPRTAGSAVLSCSQEWDFAHQGYCLPQVPSAGTSGF